MAEFPWLEEARRLLQQRRPFVLATLVEKKGHGPREPGTRAIVLEDGTLLGTIGGGETEQTVVRDAQEVFRTRQARLKTYAFTHEGCGGVVTVFLELFEPDPLLYIFGGGHVGTALAEAMAGTQFDIVVIEPHRKPSLPPGVQWLDQPAEEVLPHLIYDHRYTYLVVTTYSHRIDEAIAREVLDRPFRYLGVIGSESKCKALKIRLKRLGATDAQLARLRCPMGLFKGRRPKEVAISVAAEILQVAREPVPSAEAPDRERVRVGPGEPDDPAKPSA